MMNACSSCLQFLNSDDPYYHLQFLQIYSQIDKQYSIRKQNKTRSTMLEGLVLSRSYVRVVTQQSCKSVEIVDQFSVHFLWLSSLKSKLTKKCPTLCVSGFQLLRSVHCRFCSTELVCSLIIKRPWIHYCHIYISPKTGR